MDEINYNDIKVLFLEVGNRIKDFKQWFDKQELKPDIKEGIDMEF
ncbi:MAG: hypothetical protein PVG39_27445 [Desulfobacteraceae bacterium]|jgi:hypothetical protein